MEYSSSETFDNSILQVRSPNLRILLATCLYSEMVMHQIIQSQQTINQGNQQNIIIFITHIKNSVIFGKSINNYYRCNPKVINANESQEMLVIMYLLYTTLTDFCVTSLIELRSFLCNFPYITTDSSWRYCIQCQGSQLKRY